ncbi:MAG: hypothetical protein WC911_04405 [Thermoleophilia bacterium]
MKLKRKLGLVAAVAALMTLALSLGASGIVSASTPPDPVSCYCTQPLLSLTKASVYWGSYSDYTSRALSVNYDISNNSANYANAHSLEIVGATSTNGVTLLDNGRNVNMVPAGECELVTVKYTVPPGVGSYNTTVYATTSDQCGNSYSYPGPMPTP